METNKAIRWYGIITLFIVVAVSYIDRINIAILFNSSDFLSHIGLTVQDKGQQGFLATAFMLGYGISAFVFTPFCAALFGVRKSLIGGLTLWGGVTFISPAFDSYGMLLASRILLGISEGPLLSLASSYIKAHFEAHENGKPNALVNMGTGLGLAIGYPLIGLMLVQFEWQTSFYLLGLLNIILGIPLVLAFIHMPRTIYNIQKPRSLSEVLSQVKDIFIGAMYTRHLMLITLITCAFLAYLWGASNWLPAYLEQARGFSRKEMGWLAALPQYAIVAAVFCGGMILDKINRQHVPFIFITASTGVALCVLLAINVNDGYLATYCLTAAGFFWGLQSPAIPSTVQFFSTPEYVASAFGVTNGIGSLVAGFMPALMGLVIGTFAGDTGTATENNGIASGFFAGFSLLIGTQAVIFFCGIILWLRERSQNISMRIAEATV